MVKITIANLSAKLGRRPVLHGVHTEFEPGTLTGIIGPNGAGKSTLVRAILGLTPVTGGSIALDGCDIKRISSRDLARAIAYLPQGQILHWPLHVERVVALGRLPHMGPMARLSGADAQAVQDAMVKTGVDHLAARIATELSGGERARVMLARALAVGAKGIIADEPLASLDPGHQIDVMELLRDQARSGALVVTVLHDLTMAARYCDRLILINNGGIVAQGPPKNVLTADRLHDVYGIKGHIDMTGPSPMIVPLERSINP